MARQASPLLLRGDHREHLAATLRYARVHAIVTDPPYEIGINGEAWDKTGIAFDADVWRALREKLHDGRYLLAFGATRTHHRLATAIEAAGFQIQDEIAWFYGQGHPKQHGRLKPSHEPIVVARNGGSSSLRTGERMNTDQWGRDGRWHPNVALDPEAAELLDAQVAGASRFMYTAKPAGSERHLGSLGEKHSTVKPLNLMRWLIRLCTAPGEVVFDPYMGSGTTGAAALIEGRDFVGCELEPDHYTLALSRIADLVYPWGIEVCAMPGYARTTTT